MDTFGRIYTQVEHVCVYTHIYICIYIYIYMYICAYTCIHVYMSWSCLEYTWSCLANWSHSNEGAAWHTRGPIQQRSDHHLPANAIVFYFATRNNRSQTHGPTIQCNGISTRRPGWTYCPAYIQFSETASWTMSKWINEKSTTSHLSLTGLENAT